MAGAPKGNQNAVKRKPWTDAIRRAIARYDSDKPAESDQFLNKLADQLIADFLAGKQLAIEELTNRMDGKFPQPIVGDDDLPPVQVVSKIELVPLDGNSPGQDT